MVIACMNLIRYDYSQITTTIRSDIDSTVQAILTNRWKFIAGMRYSASSMFPILRQFELVFDHEFTFSVAYDSRRIRIAILYMLYDQNLLMA